MIPQSQLGYGVREMLVQIQLAVDAGGVLGRALAVDPVMVYERTCGC